MQTIENNFYIGSDFQPLSFMNKKKKWKKERKW